MGRRGTLDEQGNFLPELEDDMSDAPRYFTGKVFFPPLVLPYHLPTYATEAIEKWTMEVMRQTVSKEEYDAAITELVEHLGMLAYHPAHDGTAMGRRARALIAKYGETNE